MYVSTSGEHVVAYIRVRKAFPLKSIILHKFPAHARVSYNIVLLINSVQRDMLCLVLEKGERMLRTLH